MLERLRDIFTFNKEIEQLCWIKIRVAPPYFRCSGRRLSGLEALFEAIELWPLWLLMLQCLPNRELPKSGDVCMFGCCCGKSSCPSPEDVPSLSKKSAHPLGMLSLWYKRSTLCNLTTVTNTSHLVSEVTVLVQVSQPPTIHPRGPILNWKKLSDEEIKSTYTQLLEFKLSTLSSPNMDTCRKNPQCLDKYLQALCKAMLSPSQETILTKMYHKHLHPSWNPILNAAHRVQRRNSMIWDSGWGFGLAH